MGKNRESKGRKSVTRDYRIEPDKKVRLSRFDPEGGSVFRKRDKQNFETLTAANTARLADLQYVMYAENKRSLLIVLQAIDTAGKDSTIRHVCSSLNPQGCLVTSFKVPSAEEADHDFLWRISRALPRRGDIGIFNRSHYEDVLVVRVHSLVPERVWSKRYDEINAFEKHLALNGTVIVKFFLYISKDEQLKRFRDRIEDPRKHWKFSPADFEERKHWDAYMEAYEDALSKCSTEWAPWYVIPANHKWIRNYLVSQILVDTLEPLRMKFPKPAFDVSKLKLQLE
jgi:PPK2 family polyphosphate:nucleotide phosphotransferase